MTNCNPDARKPRRAPPAARPRRPLPRDRAEDDDAAADAADIVVTVVTQTDAERLPKVRHLCDRWRGALSLAVLRPPELSSDAVSRDALAHASACAPVSIQVLDAVEWGRYPVNALRNLALDGRPRETTHAWLLDIDSLEFAA